MKKFISMLCAIAMIFSMAITGFAADYGDEALVDADYQTAVDVMSAIGVFNGNKGNLYPKDTLTRAEAAKVITYFTLNKENADRLGISEDPFDDVPVDFWAAPSIAYCKNLDIVSGKGDNKYDPQGTLTGYEFAKMLLVVAGYQGDNYKGNGWDIRVNLDAISAGLLKDIDTINLSKPILREEAIQMAFNCLALDMVKITGGSNIIIGDLVISSGGVVTKTGKTVGETHYPTLIVSDAEDDDFGFNVKTWYYKGEEIATEKAYEVLATYTTGVEKITGKMVTAVLGGAGTYPVVKNGEAEMTVAIAKNDEKVFTDYKGDTITLVKNYDDTKEIIITHPEVVEITKVNDATETDKRSVVAGDYTIETNAYDKDDFILVYANENDEVIGHETADFVYGTVTQTVKKDNLIYFDGVAYFAARDLSVEPGKKYTAIMNNGYILATDTEAPAELPAEYVYVYASGELRGEYWDVQSGEYEVKYYDMNGNAKKMGTVTEYDNGLYKVVDRDDEGDATLKPVEKIGNYNKAAHAFSMTFDGTKAYFTKNTKVLAIGEKSATVLPVSDKATNYGECWVIYHTLKDTTINEVDMIITTETITTSTTDLYYSNGVDTGSVYIAGEVYNIYEVYEVATGKMIKVNAKNVEAGFNYLGEIKNGVYTFVTPDRVPAFYEGKMTAYNSLITIDGLEDKEATNATIINVVDDEVLTLKKLIEKDSVKAYIILEDDVVKTIIVVAVSD